MDKKIMFSGVQPTGKITLGNYLGTICNWKDYQEQYNCLFSVVDLHAITIRREPKVLRESVKNVLATFLATGVDPEKAILFVQSDVKEHSECSWLLNCYTYIGELNRMTQFKDKSGGKTSVSSGLYTYPILMAADILLYQTDLVPVGQDQKQHVELTRDIANRFNNEYSETFKIPEPFIPKLGAKIMDLQNPEKKMSKSGLENGCIYLSDTDAEIERKIKKAMTDTIGIVNYNDEQKGIKNLLTIQSIVEKTSIEDLVKKYENSDYKTFKDDVAHSVVKEIQPIRNKIEELKKDKVYLEEVRANGAYKASKMAHKTVRKMKKKIGL